MTDLVDPSEEYAKFHGTGKAYYRIWIVNLLLTTATFGLYSAWAKVRRLKYFLGATEYKGARFDFHGNPIAILKGRVVMAIILFLYFVTPNIHVAFSFIGIIALLIGIPFILVKSLQFRLRYTSYRNIRFAFKGTTREAYALSLRYFSFPALMAIISAGLGVYFNIAELGKTNPQDLIKYSGLAFIPNLLSIIYLLVVFHKVLNDFFSFVFNNIYYGATAVSIDSTPSEIKSEIIFPWVKRQLLATVIMIVCIVLSGVMISLIGSGGSYLSLVLLFLGYAVTLMASMFLGFAILHYIWSRLKVMDKYDSRFDLSFGEYLKIVLGNSALLVVTFGLAYPYTAIRYRKMLIESRGFDIDSFDRFLPGEHSSRGALGDELSDSLDLGFELGL